MRWLMILPGVLVVLYVVFLLLSRGQVSERVVITVDGVIRDLELRYGSKLPKVLRAAGTSLPPVVCFRCYPRSYPVRVVGRPPVSQYLVAHEVGGHVVRYIRIGWRRWWWEVVRDAVRHPFNHDARPSEQQAEHDAALLLANKLPGVNAEALLARFA